MIRSIFIAARPKTLPAAVVPVWLGCVLAWEMDQVFDLWLGVCTLLGAIFIQIATNFFNDAIDADKGADTDKRLGPQRVTASGVMTRGQVYLAGCLCVLIAAVFGWYLIDARGWVMLAIGIPSFYFAYGYTGGPWPLAYKGLGELFVIFFFGLVAVCGTYFVQTGKISWQSAMLGLQVGLLCAVLISINNIRDREEDATTNKRTFAVRYGRKKALILLRGMIFLAAIIAIVWIKVIGLLALLSYAFVHVAYIKLYQQVRDTPAGHVYNKLLAISGVLLIIFAVLFTLICVL